MKLRMIGRKLAVVASLLMIVGPITRGAHSQSQQSPDKPAARTNPYQSKLRPHRPPMNSRFVRAKADLIRSRRTHTLTASAPEDDFAFLTAFGSYTTGPGEFDFPFGITVSQGGNIYVADPFNSRVQEFTESGEFVAQFGSVGEGPGQMYLPIDVAVDPSGNVYVADFGNGRIDKFEPNGTFLFEFDAGSEFFDISNMTFANGNLYVVEEDSNSVSVFGTEGNLILSFGTIGSAPGQFRDPFGIASDTDGNIYVADTQNNRIQRFGPNGTAPQVIVSTSQPEAVAVDTVGNIYVISEEGNSVLKYSPIGTQLATFGTFGTGNGQFEAAEGVAVDSSGNIYVSDSGNARVQKLAPAGAFVLEWGSNIHGTGDLDLPIGVATDISGNVYVIDSGNSRIEEFGPTGIFLLQFPISLEDPFGIAVDHQGNIYVTDAAEDVVSKYSSTGQLVLTFGNFGTGNGDLIDPLGIALDSNNNVYVADGENLRIEEFTSSGTFVRTIAAGGSEPGQLEASPIGVAVDGAGNVFVTLASDLVQKFNSAGALQVSFGEFGFGAGGLILAEQVAVDSSGNVYVTSNEGDIAAPFFFLLGLEPVQKFDNNGNFLASLGSVGTGMGQMLFAEGIAVSPTGNVYVSDESERVIAFSQGVNMPNTPGAPVISRVVFNGKELEISGTNFGAAPRVIVNGVEVTDFLSSVSPTLGIALTGSATELNIKAGNNTVQIFNTFNIASAPLSFAEPL